MSLMDQADEVYPGLWVGGHLVHKVIPWEVLVLCAPERWRSQPKGPDVLWVELYDDPTTPWTSDQEWCDMVVLAGGAVASHVRHSRRVLVSCNMGLNRAGLISGLALRHLGLSAEAAIDKIRSERGHMALSNPVFVQAIRDFEAPRA